MAAQNESQNWLDILSKASVVSGLAAAWLLLTGWSYSYHYFYKFGIGVSSLALDLKTLPPYGFLVFLEFWGYLALAWVVVTLAVLALRRTDIPFAPSIVIALIAVGVLACFGAGYSMGEIKAQRVYTELKAKDYPGFRRVEVIVGSDWANNARLIERAQDLGGGCYRMIFDGPHAVYVFRPLRGMTALSPPVSVISKNQIVAMRLRAENASCAP